MPCQAVRAFAPSGAVSCARTVSVYLVTTSAGPVLIDSGYAQTADWLIENIRKAGFDPKLASPEDHAARLPQGALPTDASLDVKEIWFNGESIQVIHPPNAHTDGPDSRDRKPRSLQRVERQCDHGAEQYVWRVLAATDFNHATQVREDQPAVRLLETDVREPS